MFSGEDVVGCMQWNMFWSIERQKTCSFVVSTGTGAALQVLSFNTGVLCKFYAKRSPLTKEKKESQCCTYNRINHIKYMLVPKELPSDKLSVGIDLFTISHVC